MEDDMGISDSKPRVLVFAGSIRADSYHRKLAKAAAAALGSAEVAPCNGVATTYADLKDYPMPLYDGDVEAAQGVPEAAKAFKELLLSHDAFVIASPEYNGSFPALLKNVIDWTSRPEPGEKPLAAFRGKTAAILSTSPGPGGGQRGLRHLRELLEMIGVRVIPAQLTIPRAFESFDAKGALVRPEDRNGLTRVVSDLVLAVRGQGRAAA
ncbi:NADPH-dependent FMN reductase (modular protein) [Candidatus Sulfopaludibacter sp. SbA6]|nr:NADPH-dependent FMN reductase (modular protein) [Candidatus Sulfopaludibacter sp. SbA6]